MNAEAETVALPGPDPAGATAKRNRVLIAAAIFLLALLMRLAGLGWGLKNDLHNQSYHPDEPVIFGFSQQIDLAKFQFSPPRPIEHFYSYGTLYLTLLSVAADMTASYTGAADPKSSDSVWSFVSRVHLAGRLMSALAGAGTAVALFFMLWRVGGALAGLAGGLLIAVSPGHLIHSDFQTVDIMALFFLACGTLFALRFADLEHAPDAKDGLKWAALAGVFFGLSAGTKYTGLLGVLTLFVCLWLAKRPNALKEAAVGLGSALLMFAITTPGMFLDSSHFMTDFAYEMQHTSEGHGLVFTATSPGFIYHVVNLFVGIGVLLTLMGVVGLVLAAVKKQIWALALLAFFVPYYVLIGRAEVKFLRYTFPLYVGIAAGFGWLIGKSRREGTLGKATVAVGILALGGIDTGGVTGSARALLWLTEADPRDQAAAYLRAHSQEETVAGLPSDPWTWSVPLFKDSTAPRSMPFPARLEEMQAARKPKVVYYIGADGDRHAFDPALLTQDKPQFVPITSLEVQPISHLDGVTGLPGDAQVSLDRYKSFTAELEKRYKLVQIFGYPSPPVEDIQYVQPQVWLWQRNAP